MTIDSVLIVKLSAIGDVIHALPVAYAIKETYPNAKVTWVVEPPAYDLLTNNPYIDDIIVFEKQKFKTLGGFMHNLPSFSAFLRQKQYDVVMDLQGLGKSAAIALISRAKLKIGCVNMREGSNLVSKSICGPNADGHIVERYLDVARSIGCKVNDVIFPVNITSQEAQITKQIMQQAGMRSGNRYVVFVIGANWPNKRWPADYYATLGMYLYDRNIIPVLIGGGATDRRIADDITAAMLVPPIDLVGKTTLKQLAYVLKNAAVVVGGDTGPLHLAAGLNRPVVALLGPTDINRNGPYHQSENALEIPESCKHCWKRSCALDKDCLAAITAERVIAKLARLI